MNQTKRFNITKSSMFVLISCWILAQSSALTAQNDGELIEAGTIVKDRVDVEMIYVPAATYVVGIDREELLRYCETSGESNPQHCVQIVEEDTGATYTFTADIPAFWIDRYEVTIEEFNEHCIASVGMLTVPCADSISDYRPELAEDPQQPRVGVSWERAMTFCAARGARLPTEVEWEYAASGPDKLIFPWGNEFNPDYVHSRDDTYPPSQTYPVGSVPENRSWVGVYDMAGNAAEWTEDRFLPRILSGIFPITLKKPLSFVSEIARVTRGGSSDGRTWPMTTFYRESERPTVDSEYIGFRCARSIYPGD